MIPKPSRHLVECEAWDLGEVQIDKGLDCPPDDESEYLVAFSFVLSVVRPINGPDCCASGISMADLR